MQLTAVQIPVHLKPSPITLQVDIARHTCILGVVDCTKGVVELGFVDCDFAAA